MYGSPITGFPALRRQPASAPMNAIGLGVAVVVPSVAMQGFASAAQRLSLIVATAFLLTTSLATPGLYSGQVAASEIAVLNRENWTDFRIIGKEADSIYGDLVLRNDRFSAVIAAPLPTRNANMTVRGVGGCLIDMSSNAGKNDQLSCFYPLGSRYDFTDAERMSVKVDGELVDDLGSGERSGNRIELTFESMPHSDGSVARISYRIWNDSPYLEIQTEVLNLSDTEIKFTSRDAIRADRTFRSSTDDEAGLCWVYDEWFRACYGIMAPERSIEKSGNNISYADGGDTEMKVAGDSSYKMTRLFFSAPSELELLGVAREILGHEDPEIRLTVRDARGPVNNARVEISSAGEEVAVARTFSEGELNFRLPKASYQITVTGLGRPEKTIDVDLSDSLDIACELEECGYVQVIATDVEGGQIPCKVSFYGAEGTADPYFGPDSRAVATHNTRYTSSGRFRQQIPPGSYQVVISRGPEYDAHVEAIEVEQGEVTRVITELKRVVETPGWVSTEYHSHSTPSGDNTSVQYGRVLNLLAEQIEFAPCTEHNRISSYMPHINSLDAHQWLATCPGMELTGGPLPVNHQNAFPLRRRPRRQDGGGPTTDVDPVIQIERLALWDYGSDKLVQTNHPNLMQILGDKDLDQEADSGFEAMFQFMDVMEIHPPASILERPTDYGSGRGNVIFNWLQLLNQGYRIPGVVNTDAHYNFHGSGWLRNYVKSSTDEPIDISVAEMVRNSEAGHIIMTTGPYMEVSMTSVNDGEESAAIPGDDLHAAEGKVSLKIRVQCPNWLDINRVQIYLNGRMPEEHNYTRRAHAEWFGNDVVKFDQEIELTLTEDTHVIVAAAGEGLTLGRVMGPSFGNQMPIAVSNPIFVDLAGDGFDANKDRLGAPLPLRGE